MKVIIADDEKLVRVSLRSMLDELNLPLEILGEATNGEEMVDLATNYAPDIVFVDIQMPRMSGLAGIKAGKKVSPNTQWIILTGFSEFDYAREAIRLGAANYLLKPVSPEQLKEALWNVMERIQKTIISANKEFENDVIAFFHGLSPLPNEGENSVFSRARFKAAIFLIDSQLDEKWKAERQLKFCQMLRQLITELLGDEVRFALFTLQNGDLATLSAWGFVPGLKGKEMSEAYFSRVEQLVKQFNNEKFTITLLDCGEYISLTELVDEQAELEVLAPLRTVLGMGKKLTGKVLNECKHDRFLINISGLLMDLAHSYKEINYATFMKSLRAFEKITVNMAAEIHKIKKPLADFIGCAIGCQVDQDREIKYWIKNLAEHGEQLLKIQNEKKHLDSDIIERVISYVDQNYRFDIGISQIAEKFAVTPNYLSTLFHKKTGKGFMKYLTEIRMFKAKELLADPNLQIQQVAEEVGYYSGRYFTKLFTQFVGCYPSEYRKKFDKLN